MEDLNRQCINYFAKFLDFINFDLEGVENIKPKKHPKGNFFVRC